MKIFSLLLKSHMQELTHIPISYDGFYVRVKVKGKNSSLQKRVVYLLFTLHQFRVINPYSFIAVH